MSAALATSVIVVSHNSGPLLRRCVQSVLAQSIGLELIVVDNASHDGSLADLPTDARLRVLRNADNRGFGAACNQGAALARAPQLLMLNPDCLLPLDALSAMHALLTARPECGLLGAQLLNDDGSLQRAAKRNTPTPARAIRRALGLRGDAVELEADPDADALADISDVDAISGALMLMPRALFEHLGGFDEGYVLHCEDLDLCRRVLQSGYRIGVANTVRVPHHQGSSSRRRPVWVEWQKHRGMLRYFRKFDAAASPWWLRLAVPLGVWLRFPLAAWGALRRSARQR